MIKYSKWKLKFIEPKSYVQHLNLGWKRQKSLYIIYIVKSHIKSVKKCKSKTLTILLYICDFKAVKIKENKG